MERVYCSESEGEKLAREDIFSILEKNPGQVTAVLKALEDGRVDGMNYFGECSCLLGTIAMAREGRVISYRDLHRDPRYSHEDSEQLLERLTGRSPNYSSPAEGWFGGIRHGHTPATDDKCALTYNWIRSWAEDRGLLK